MSTCTYSAHQRIYIKPKTRTNAGHALAEDGAGVDHWLRWIQVLVLQGVAQQLLHLWCKDIVKDLHVELSGLAQFHFSCYIEPQLNKFSFIGIAASPNISRVLPLEHNQIHGTKSCSPFCSREISTRSARKWVWHIRNHSKRKYSEYICCCHVFLPGLTDPRNLGK